MMAVSHLSAGFLLFCTFPFISSIESYWEELSGLRNNMLVPDPSFAVEITSSLFACVSLCLMTDGCCFVSYIAITRECVRHSKWLGYQHRDSSSVWNMLKDDGCACEWYRVQDSCLSIFNASLSWQESITYCQVLGSRLAEVDTEPKDTFLRGRLLAMPGDIMRVWIGGSDTEEENTWLWTSSGLPIANFTNWDINQPDNWATEAISADCLCMGGWGGFLWHDCNCVLDGALVCEKPVL